MLARVGQSVPVTTPDPVSEHEQSSNHREAVLAARVVGCFYCRRIYDPAEIAEWVDEDAAGVGCTAVCPRCGIDAVIPARDGVDVAFLETMHRHWFSVRAERVEPAVADYVYERATKALASVPADQRADAYVVSFFVCDYEDDPRRPTLTIGTNTERQAAAMIHAASDAAKARWNYAFWLQNESATVGGPLDPNGEGLVRASFDAAGHLVRGRALAATDKNDDGEGRRTIAIQATVPTPGCH